MEGIAMCNSSSTVIRIRDEQGTERVTTVNIPNSHEAVIEINNVIPNSHEAVIEINNVHLLQCLPSRELLEDKNAVRELCVPLQTAAIKDDWGTTKRIIEKDRRTLTSSITSGGQNVLHLAAGTNNVDFVDKLVRMLSNEELELRDDNGNTALCFAAATAPIEIADIMIKRNPSLVSIRGGGEVTPLYVAAQFDKPDMARYLYDKTKESLEDRDRGGIFFSCIDNGIYELALKMLNDNKALATAEDDVGKIALHHLAETPSAFTDGQPEGWTKLAAAWLNFKFKRTAKQTSALDLVGRLWEEVINLGHERAMALISSPSELLFEAAKLGNYEFLKVLVTSCPDLLWKVDSENRTIIHVAVLYRHADIFNMIHDIGPKREVILGYNDVTGNNILHLAAESPPPDRLKTVSGAALQVQKELIWFEEVDKIVPPRYRRLLNANNMNPSQLFSSEHSDLMNEGEKWLKDTSHSGLIVSTIITTVVFAAAFSLPGGNDDKGHPNDLHYTSFLVFVLSDGLAMLSSVVASLMFLSILTSRYTEYDFRNSLPLKLMTALFALFFSNMAMMVAFSSTITIACHSGLRWVPFFISLFAFVPIALFAVSQFPLWFDTFSSTYWSRTVFKPARRTLC